MNIEVGYWGRSERTMLLSYYADILGAVLEHSHTNQMTLEQPTIGSPLVEFGPLVVLS